MVLAFFFLVLFTLKEIITVQFIFLQIAEKGIRVFWNFKAPQCSEEERFFSSDLSSIFSTLTVILIFLEWRLFIYYQIFVSDIIL